MKKIKVKIKLKRIIRDGEQARTDDGFVVAEEVEATSRGSKDRSALCRRGLLQAAARKSSRAARIHLRVSRRAGEEEEARERS